MEELDFIGIIVLPNSLVVDLGIISLFSIIQLRCDWIMKYVKEYDFVFFDSFLVDSEIIEYMKEVAIQISLSLILFLISSLENSILSSLTIGVNNSLWHDNWTDLGSFDKKFPKLKLTNRTSSSITEVWNPSILAWDLNLRRYLKEDEILEWTSLSHLLASL